MKKKRDSLFPYESILNKVDVKSVLFEMKIQILLQQSQGPQTHTTLNLFVCLDVCRLEPYHKRKVKEITCDHPIMTYNFGTVSVITHLR